MGSAFTRALELLFSGDALLTSIIKVTLTMTLFSSCTALLLGAPYGVLLASVRFPGRRVLIMINRTFMGLPPVVCGLLCAVLGSLTLAIWGVAADMPSGVWHGTWPLLLVVWASILGFGPARWLGARRRARAEQVTHDHSMNQEPVSAGALR